MAEAIAAPRLSLTGTGSGLSIEDGFPRASIDALLALGYTASVASDIGSVQMVLIDPRTGRRYGAADPRREGTVIALPRPH